MKGIDLIPGTRRELQRRRTRVRAWVGAGCAYAAVLAGTLAAAAAAWPRDQETPAAALAAATMENDQHRRQLTLLSAEIAQKQRELAANRAVGNQPDWSVLLALVAEALGPEAALREAELTLDAAPTPPPAPAQAAGAAPANKEKAAEAAAVEPPRSFSLQLSGIARSQVAVNAVVTRLEGTGLFERIELVETRREVVGEQDVTSFRFRCRMGERRAGP